MSTTVSAKIPIVLKKKLKRYGVSTSKVIRTALEEEALRREEEHMKERLEQISRKIRGKVSREDIVRAVRESREER